MNDFTPLRKRALAKRDAAIAQARKEYAETLAAISALEQDLCGKESSRHKKMSVCIERCIPADREFTTLDIMAGLEALDPTRVWRMRSIHSHLSRLRDKGIIRRIKRHRNLEPAVYARNDVAVAPLPFQGMTLTQAIESILVKPMTATAITVALLEGGWETSMARKALLNAVSVKLRSGGFQSEGGRNGKNAKWSLE